MKDNKSRGLGDSIEKFTKATGIHSLAQAGARVLGKKRQEALNKKFPYKK